MMIVNILICYLVNLSDDKPLSGNNQKSLIALFFKT